jgi:hypothetical protein
MVERAIQYMTEEGGAGAVIGPEGLVLGMPNWEERTRHQRLSEKVKSHGYPLGFGKSQVHLRVSLLEDQRARTDTAGDEDRVRHMAAHEAVAWALDAERFLGSFRDGEGGGFPKQNVDRVADHILAWLGYRGFQVVPKSLAEAVSETEPEAAMDDEEVADDYEQGEESIEYEGPGGYERLSQAELDRRLGTNRVPCLKCGGEGEVDGMGPVSWSCDRCLGSGSMPVSAIEECLEDLRALHSQAGDNGDGRWEWYSDELSGVDFSGVPLSAGTFYECDFSRANFNNADLTDTEFDTCDLTGSNPEAAASLDRAVFRAPRGLGDKQIARIVEQGGTVER